MEEEIAPRVDTSVPAGRPRRRAVAFRSAGSNLAIAGGVLTFLALPSLLGVGSAAFTATTITSGNSITAFPAARVASFTASATLPFPFLVCYVNFAWTASPTAGVTGYRIEQLIAGSTVHVAWVNPDPLAATATTASQGFIPGTAPGLFYDWRIEAVTAAGTSAWVTATESITLPGC